MKTEQIDFVIPWVDGSDPEWRKKKEKYTGEASGDDSEQRYRGWGLMRYWFRGVEKFAPWVHHIWFICDQEPPAWLNRTHPKLTVVRHEDYLPPEYRPAFSSHPIELNLHRIKGLSERFVYFNDDMFLLRPVKKTMFFRNGLPCDSAVMNPVPTDTVAKNGADSRVFLCFLNNAEYLNRDYDFHDCVRRHPFKWLNPCYGADALRNFVLCAWPRFVGFAEDHLPNAFLKSSFAKAWEQDFDILDKTSRHHIRDDRDVNQWFIRMRQLADGSFVPRARRKNCCFEIHEDAVKMHLTIRKQLKPMICVNDVGPLEDETFRRLKKKLRADFGTILGAPSEFETETAGQE